LPFSVPYSESIAALIFSPFTVSGMFHLYPAGGGSEGRMPALGPAPQAEAQGDKFLASEWPTKD
jgi:hypothetical protein